MFTPAETSLLLRVVISLTEHGETSLANEVNEALLATAQHRAALATAAKDRKAGARGRRPSVAYDVAMEPGWSQRVTGAGAAYESVKKALKEADALALLPKRQSFGVMLSSRGQWQAVLETDNGVATLTVNLAR